MSEIITFFVSKLLFYLKWCIKHNQFGAGRYKVITSVRLHKPGVHIVLRVWRNETVVLFLFKELITAFN